MTAAGSPVARAPLQSAFGSPIPSVSVPFVLGMALLALAVATLVSLLYRLIMDETVPWHVPLIVGVGVVGLWMNTASTVVEFIERTAAQEPLLLQNMRTNSLAIVASAVASIGGVRLGDRLAPGVGAIAGIQRTEARVGTIVRTLGRFIAVELPETDEIRDLEGYERVPEETKERFAGVEFLFPRGLTLDRLHRRVVDRLRDDYGVGGVDLELDEEGTVTYLAVGGREGGIGPTLPARRGAISLRTTPAPEATPGDRVQVWTAADAGAERITTAELRAAGEETATLVADVRHIEDLDQSRTYDLVTVRSEKRPELEFASLLRTANEALDSVEVAPESPLVGIPVGALVLPVLAVRTAGGGMQTAPPREYVLGTGDTAYVIGRPDELRKFETAADPTAPA